MPTATKEKMPTAKFLGVRPKILADIKANSHRCWGTRQTLIVITKVIKFFLCQSQPSRLSCIILQLITVVSLNIFCIVFKEIYFLKTKTKKN